MNDISIAVILIIVIPVSANSSLCAVASEFGVTPTISRRRLRSNTMTVNNVGGGFGAANHKSRISSSSSIWPLFCSRQVTLTKNKSACNEQIFSSPSYYYGGDDTTSWTQTRDVAPSISSLIIKARQLRKQIYGSDRDTKSFLQSLLKNPTKNLSYSSSFYSMIINQNEGQNNIFFGQNPKTASVPRGYCNWLLPNKVMIGSYPGVTPEINGPTFEESRRHIQNLVQKAQITLFCSLQSEVPCQMEDNGWISATTTQEVVSGEIPIEEGVDVVYLEPDSLRSEFPRPFTRYGPLAQSFAAELSSSSSSRQLTFLHSPINDLGVPSCNANLLSLLSTVLNHLLLEDDANTTHDPKIYLHCWGGRGRAGLVGACLASLLFPEVSSDCILNWIQSGYDTRLGSEKMSAELKRSPQTVAQRRFVKEFVSMVQKENGGKDIK